MSSTAGSVPSVDRAHTHSWTNPAKEAMCHKCKKKGHCSTQCFRKEAAEITTQPVDDIDMTYLNTVGTGSHTS